MSLANKTVVELKALLKKKGLPVAGRKAELIARLEESPSKKKAAVKKTSTKKVPSSKYKYVYIFRSDSVLEAYPLVFETLDLMEGYIHKTFGKKKDYKEFQEAIEEMKQVDNHKDFDGLNLRIGVVRKSSLLYSYELYKIRVVETSADYEHHFQQKK